MPSPSYSPSQEIRDKIKASMKARMLEKFPMDKRRGFVKRRKGPKPLTALEREDARERKNRNDRVRRKNKWYKEAK